MLSLANYICLVWPTNKWVVAKAAAVFESAHQGFFALHCVAQDEKPFKNCSKSKGKRTLVLYSVGSMADKNIYLEIPAKV